jgi:hypothetical protein
LASDTMIHAETVSCIAALDLDATSAVESKLFLAENLPSLPRDASVRLSVVQRAKVALPS